VSTSSDALLAAWEKSLAENRDKAAILDRQGHIVRTFAAVEQRAKFLAQKLESLASGEVAAVQIGNHPDWPSLFIACLRRKIVVLPLERSVSTHERTMAMEICRASALFTVVRASGDNEEITLRDSDVAVRNVNDGRDDISPRARTADVSWDGPPPALLKLTSGTTAAPRAIRFRSAQLLADCENICTTMEIDRGDLNYGVIPISHSYGFSNLLTPLIARAVPMALSTDRMPRAIADGVAATGATVLPGMPVFYQSLCELNDVLPLSDLRLCISAGAPLSPELANKFRARFQCEIHSFYGSSECGGICYARRPEAVPGFVGEAMQGVEIELLDSETRPSRIRVRSDAVGDGYLPEPDDSKLGRGSFLPDDLLEKIGRGYRIVGRVSDLINVAGKKVNPAEVEAEILKFPGVRAVIAFGRESKRRHQEVAACVVANSEVSETELLGYLRLRLSSWQVPRRVFFVEAIPVNERGKTSRRELARRFI
jgi:acyl-CoA synthetase (AMP-forming)/AMP-acid ligase II